MKNILNFSEAFNIGLHAMAVLGVSDTKKIPVKDLAKTICASDNHLSKVMQRLSKANLVSSINGPSGGFFIIKPVDSIRILDIYEAIEGNLPVSNCMFLKKICNKKYCPMGTLIEQVSNTVLNYFSNTKLSEIIKQ